MYVEVIPAIRSLRGNDWFTYHSANQQYRVGEVVLIPWRSKTIPGVIHSITVTQPNFTTKAITSSTGVVLPKPYLDFIYWFSKHYHIALTSTIKLMLPKLPKRHQSSHTPLPTTLSQSKLAIATQAQTIVVTNPNTVIGLIHHIAKQEPNARCAIIVPEEWHVQWLNSALKLASLVVVTGTTNTGKLWKAWLTMLSDQPNWYLGTKRLSLFPLSQLDHLIIVYPEDQSHKQWDLNPRYHVWTIARYWNDHTPLLDVLAFSESPRVEQVVQTKINLSEAKQFTLPTITLLPMTGQAVPLSHGLLSYSLLERCQLNQTLLLWCYDSSSLANILRSLLPGRIITELTHDNSNTSIDYSQQPIIVSNSYSQPQLNWEEIDTIAIVAIDWLLAQPRFRAHEEVLHTLVYLRNRTRQLVIQTRVPEHPVFQALRTFFPATWYQAQLKERQQYQLPPYGDFILARPSSERAETWHQIQSLPSNNNWIIDREQ